MQHIQNYLILNSYSFILIIILCVVFYTKQRQRQVEDSTYSTLLMINFFLLISSIILGMMVVPQLNISTNIIIIVNKIYLICLLLWVLTLNFYTFYISVIKEGEAKNSITIFCTIAMVMALIVSMLPMEVNVLENHTTFKGISIIFTYICIILSFLSQFIMIVIDRKNLKNPKYMPIYLLIFFGIILLILQITFPHLNYLINPTIVLIVVIMFFTIENPDMKIATQMQYAKENAEKANRVKSDFLSSVSHEIRTPLNTIVGSIELLEEEKLSKEGKETLQDLLNASDSILEIVSDILDISQIESGNLEIMEEEYNPIEELTELYSLLERKVSSKPIKFTVSFSEDLPNILYGDNSKLKQIVTNLLVNAIKYTDEGEILFKVDCQNKDDKCLLIISIHDTGRGIKEEMLDKIFDKFARDKDVTNSTIEGVGLGLAITKSLVDLMEGEIEVESIYKKGSVFTVSIPQKIINPIVDVNKNEKLFEKINENKRILIVDDNVMNLKIEQRMLESYNLAIETVGSGYECIDNIQSGNIYDLILMDDMMPNMSGTETMKLLKNEMHYQKPIVVITANAKREDKDKYLKNGFDDYISKPVRKEDLYQKVSEYLK